MLGLYESKCNAHITRRGAESYFRSLVKHVRNYDAIAHNWYTKSHKSFKMVRESNQIKSNQFTGLNNSTCAPKTIYIRTMSVLRSSNVRENGAPVGIQAILEAGNCRGLSGVGRESVSRSGRRTEKAAYRLAIWKWLTDLEVMPSEVTCSWRFKELLRRQVQTTVEQLVHRDESSTEKVSLHRGKFEFVEA